MAIQAQYVTRVIALQTQESLASAADCLQSLDAVTTVSMLPNKHAIEIEYDQCKISYLLIGDHLRQQGVALKAGWFDRFKAQWFDYVDNTERENVSAPPPACCNKPPKPH